jgi:hypothetical protein
MELVPLKTYCMYGCMWIWPLICCTFNLIWIQFGTESAHTKLLRDCFKKRHLECRECLEEVCELSLRMPFSVFLWFVNCHWWCHFQSFYVLHIWHSEWKCKVWSINAVASCRLIPRLTSGAHLTYLVGTGGYFCGGKAAEGIKLTTQLHRLPKVTVSEGYTYHVPYSFMMCLIQHKNNFTFIRWIFKFCVNITLLIQV